MAATDASPLAAVEEQLERLERLPAAERERGLELVQALLEFHGAGLARMIDAVAAHDGDGQLAEAFGADELISHLLMLHGLHPVSLGDRVVAALDEVRPYLESHGGNVQLLDISGETVELELQGSCSGCPSSALTLKSAVEEAIHKHAPEIAEIHARDAADKPDLIQIENLLGTTEPSCPVPSPRVALAADVAAKDGPPGHLPGERTKPAAPQLPLAVIQTTPDPQPLAVADPDEETCELCGAPVPAEHRHVVDVEGQRLLCACQPCSLLFDKDGAGGGHFRLVPDRRLALDDLALPDQTWEALAIPVDMAFFFTSSAAGRVLAFYPSPMGATESQLELAAWSELTAANPVLAGMAPDTEALLVNRARGARRAWLVPIDDPYRLVALIRTRWRGFSGGAEAWQGINEFFDDLDRRATRAHPQAA